MKTEQYVMAYKAEQDRLRALLPQEFKSLRPVLRINAEIRYDEDNSEKIRELYLEFNTPVAAYGKRGWLNIANWRNSDTKIEVHKDGKCTTFITPFLEISYTGVGVTGGCPAENDNDGCFYIATEGLVDSAVKTDYGKYIFTPAISITPDAFGYREFCNCSFAWNFSVGDARGKSNGDKSIPAFYETQSKEYKKEALTPENTAKIPCQQVLGSYFVVFNC